MRANEHFAQAAALGLGCLLCVLFLINSGWGIDPLFPLVVAWAACVWIDWRAIRRLERENFMLSEALFKAGMDAAWNRTRAARLAQRDVWDLGHDDYEND